jgi:hypothetical protein
MPIVDLRGKTFGRLTVLKRVPQKPSEKKAMWLCHCTCGTVARVVGRDLRTGHTQSCGCLHRENWIGNRTTHGKSKTSEYEIWCSMIKRCHGNPNGRAFKWYGAKGVTVEESWRHNFEQFLADVGPRPSKEHSLDRYPNPFGNYERGNVRWATRKEQARNKINSRMITFNGRTQPLADWADETGINQATIRHRIDVYKWTVERALSTPVPIEWTPEELASQEEVPEDQG